MRSSSTVGDLREKFCEKSNTDANATRFLINGERLEDKTFLKWLDLEERDRIEVFLECRGGGPQTKKHLLKSDEDILDALCCTRYL